MTRVYSALTQRKDRGFTLIELLVVIAIIAILAALILAALSSARKGARDSTRRSDLKQYQVSLNSYAADNSDNFPQTTNFPGALTLNQKYMAQALTAPGGTATGYVYQSAGATTFGLCAQLEKDTGQMFRVGPTVAKQTGYVAACVADGDAP